MTSWKCFISSVWFPHLSTKLSNSRYTKVSQFGSKVHTDSVVLIGSLPEARATKFSAEWQLPNGISTLHSAVQPQQSGMHYVKCATLFMVILKLPCSSKHLHSYTCTSKRRNLREGMYAVNASLACDPENFLYQWTACYSLGNRWWSPLVLLLKLTNESSSTSVCIMKQQCYLVLH